MLGEISGRYVAVNNLNLKSTPSAFYVTLI